jgi:hypothetical protein
VGDHHRAGLRKDAVQVFDDFRLFGFFHFALLTSARVTIRVPTLLLSLCPRVQTRTGEVFSANPVSSLSVLEIF